MGSFSDTNVYAVIDPEGELHFCRGVPHAMWRKCDPHHETTPSGFAVVEAPRWTGSLGMRGFVSDVSALFPDLYWPNPVGRALASALSSQQVIRLFGNLVLCGWRYFDDGEAGEVGLSEVQ